MYFSQDHYCQRMTVLICTIYIWQYVCFPASYVGNQPWIWNPSTLAIPVHPSAVFREGTCYLGYNCFSTWACPGSQPGGGHSKLCLTASIHQGKPHLTRDDPLHSSDRVMGFFQRWEGILESHWKTTAHLMLGRSSQILPQFAFLIGCMGITLTPASRLQSLHQARK